MTTEVVLEIPQGKLKGLKEKSFVGDVFYSYQGIPYAKPPVGELRFKSPQPAEKWEGTRDATKSRAIAPSLVSGAYSKDSNEDCLFANVYTKQAPLKPSNKYPVMVWVHGGGFANSSGNRNGFSPEFFMRRDVVLVTFNYRLGALGFLSLKTPECPGNYGLKDQRLLLQWVNQNISYFGGDPENVTIFGQSAGSISITYLVVTSTTKGLFKRAIAESGTCWGSHIPFPREVAFALAKRLGLETTDDKKLLDFMKKASPKDLVEKAHLLLNDVQAPRPEESILNYAFMPSVEPESSEDAIITEEPAVLLEKGQFQDVPLIVGDCVRELLGLGISSKQQLPSWSTDKEFQNAIPRFFSLKKDSELSLEVAKKVRQFFFKDGITIENYVDMASDSRYNYRVYSTIKSKVGNPNFKTPIYSYIFSYEGGRSIFKKQFGVENIPGTVHKDDVGYLFHVPQSFPLPEVNSDDYKFIEKFVDLWVDFATTGEPPEDVKWQPADGTSVKYLDIGKEFEKKDGFFKERMDFWDSIKSLIQNSK